MVAMAVLKESMISFGDVVVYAGHRLSDARHL